MVTAVASGQAAAEAAAAEEEAGHRDMFHMNR